MLETNIIVINTAPLISIIAAIGDLRILQSLYTQVLVPFEVCQEILAGGASGFAVSEFEDADWLQKSQIPLTNIYPFLLNSLDLGEASVIQLALNENIQTICIDEAAGRRVARLSGLSVTGTIGILLRGHREGYPIDIKQAIDRMIVRGIRLSETIINFALQQTGEIDP
jgi:predicted nucleic acid-binding protein